MFLCLAGGKLIIGAGEVESLISCDPLQLVIDDEIMRIARRWIRRMEVSEETLALDVIERVGPRGQFLDADHTVEHLRAGELIQTEFFERIGRETWLAGGSKTLVSTARVKEQAILQSHQVPPLPKEVTKELGRILKRADEGTANA